MTPSEQASQKRRQERQEMLADLNRQAEMRRQQVKDLLNQCATDRDRDADKRRQMRREVLTRISEEVKEIVSPANANRPLSASQQLSGAAEAAIVAATSEAMEDPLPPAPVQAAPVQAAPVQATPVQATPMPAAPKPKAATDDAAPKAIPAPIAAPMPVPNEAKPTASPQRSLSPNTIPQSTVAINNLSREASPGTAALARSLHQTSSTTPEKANPVVSKPSSPSPATAFSSEDRLRLLEESFARLLDSVGSSAAFLVRIEALERKMTSLPETLGEMLARPHPVEAKLDSVRADMRAMDISVDSLSAQMKNCESICHTLGADVRKLSAAMEGIAGELRHTQERNDNLDHDRLALLKETQSELGTLQERITRVESGVVRAIHLLQSSEQGSAQVAHLRERFQEIEMGFQQVLQAVDSWQRAGESPEAAAERQATAKVLASLSNLLQGLRSAQQEKQGPTAADKAIHQGALTA